LPAFADDRALNITLSVDKTKLFLGENFTLSGKITFMNGTAGVFDYRAAVVAPKRVIICDTNRTQTAADGMFTLFCQVPTVDQANALGIPASRDRSVIPLKPGVAVLVPGTNQTIKKHTREVLAINPDKFRSQLNAVANDIDNFANRASVIVTECDKIIERAQRFNVTSVADKCAEIKARVNDLIANAHNLSAQARQLRDNLNATSVRDFRDGLAVIKDDMKDLRDALKDLKEVINNIRWEVLREVREIKRVNATAIKIEQLQEKINELRNRTGVSNE